MELSIREPNVAMRVQNWDSQLRGNLPRGIEHLRGGQHRLRPISTVLGTLRPVKDYGARSRFMHVKAPTNCFIDSKR